MREIKFRYWNKEDGVMVDGDSLAFEEYAPLSHLLSVDGIMQYTGLKDKNGKEIYEGDVIKTKHSKHVSENDGDPFAHYDIEDYEKIGFIEHYIGYQYGYRLRWKKGHIQITGGNMIVNMNGEVVGNIYETPELIGRRASITAESA